MAADTLHDIDAALLDARDRYLAAVDADDVEACVKVHDELDYLLDRRLHCPQQR